MERCGTDPKQGNDELFFFIESPSSSLSLNSLPISTHRAPYPTFQQPSLLLLPTPEEACKAQIRLIELHKGTLLPNEQKYSHLKRYIKCLCNEGGDSEVIVGAGTRQCQTYVRAPLMDFIAVAI